ncbi:MAG: hypothetical protein HW373_1631, partial [Deltaproteobacteria bacterium]|nr:hypothetical protein [Deltaproteobacteria bacterium]
SVETFLCRYVIPPLNILDWGGDTGLNTPFGSQSKLFHIYDISKKPAIEGALRVDKDTIQITHYDLIVLSHVLEHLPYPAKTIMEIRSVMKKDTVHEHINFFTRESLNSLLECCGLEAIDVQSIEAAAGDVKNWHVFAIACKLHQS